MPAALSHRVHHSVNPSSLKGSYSRSVPMWSHSIQPVPPQIWQSSVVHIILVIG